MHLACFRSRQPVHGVEAEVVAESRRRGRSSTTPRCSPVLPEGLQCADGCPSPCWWSWAGPDWPSVRHLSPGTGKDGWHFALSSAEIEVPRDFDTWKVIQGCVWGISGSVC